ncbi:MAG: hypothetical protein ACE5HS_07700 [bacterium]
MVNSYSKKFILTLTDAFYSHEILESFLLLLDRLFVNKFISEKTFEFQILNASLDSQFISRINVQKTIRYLRGDPKEINIQRSLQNSHAFLFIQRAEGKGFISNRFYEFVTCQKKVLALVPNTSTFEELTRELPEVYCADIRSPFSICSAFIQMFSDWEKQCQIELWQTLLLPEWKTDFQTSHPMGIHNRLTATKIPL